MRTFPGVVPVREGSETRMKRVRRGKGDTERRRYRNEREEKKEQVDREYGPRKWREGQLEGGKIYLRATGVRIVRGRLVFSA